ncbi:MAG TPA: FAD-dependent monooxygenase [Chthoniobacterales bacterium]|jgi:putative polyketide hydroxylase
MRTTDPEVAIIGAGPCGLLTALVLARRGIRCAVFERRAEPLDHPRAMAISRRTSEIFQQLGIRDAMEVSHLRPGDYDLAIWETSLAGEIHGHVPWRPDDPSVVPYPGLHCPQTVTERVLREALAAEATAGVFFDHDVLSHEETADGVRLQIRRSPSDATFPVAARYVVAADGAGSPMRRSLGIEAIGPGDLGHFLNTCFRAPYGASLRERRAVLHHLLRKDLFEVFVAINGDDLWLMHHFLQPGEDPADYPPERLADIVREASGLPEVPVEVLGVTQWVMSPKIANAFRKGRVFLTGDAAARLSPAGGLGMNTGLQSAHNLAWKLAAVLRGAPASLLDSYDTERRGHVMETFSTSNDFGKEVWTILEAGLAGDYARVRELVAGSRRGGGGLGLDLGFAYRQGALVPSAQAAPQCGIDAYTPSALPGRRAPHCRLGDGEQTFSCLDLFGHDFVLLVAGDPAPWRADTPLPGGYGLEIHGIGAAGLRDVDGAFASIYGLAPGEAVLVRPDGVVGARLTSSDALPSALATILGGGPAVA